MTRRLLLAIPLACLAAAALLGLPAQPARAEGKQGDFSISPSVELTTVFDDNLLLTDSDEASSFGVWLRPRIELGYRTETLDLGADLGADVRRYADYYSELADEFWNINGHAEVGLLPGLTFRAANSFVPNPVQLGLPPDQGINMVQTNRTDAELRYWLGLPGEREVSFGMRGTRFFSDGFSEDVPGSGGTVILDDSFHADYWGGTGYVEYQEPLGRRTSGYARAQAGYRSFDDSPQSDDLDYSLLLGVRSLRFRNTEIDVAGGYGRIHFSSLGQQPRIMGRANLRYRLPSGWSWRLGVNHLTSADLLGNAALETTGSIGVEKRFADGRTAAGVNLFITRFDSKSWSGGANLFGGAELQVRRQLTRRTQLRVAYRHWNNQGDYQYDDMKQNRLLIDLSLRY
ncbi:MAG TPA: hypothetical protein VII72_17385 [Myxococcota bacterium]